MKCIIVSLQYLIDTTLKMFDMYNIGMNIYQQQNPKYFQDLNDLIQCKPRGFKQMLEAKGRKRDVDVVPKYKYLFDWINEILPECAKHISIKEKCYWILHGIDDFPKCKVCGKQLNQSSFLNVIRGYRLYCSHVCATQSDSFSKHISEAQKKCIINDPLHYVKKAEKSKATRMQRYGTYTSNEAKAKSKATIEKHIAENQNYFKDIEQKRKQTKIKNGHDPNWHNEEQMVKTRYAKHNGKWEDELTLSNRKNHAFEKYGVDDANKSEIVKLHKKQAFQKKYGENVITVFQTPQFKQHMININEQRKQKEFKTKRKNKSFNVSKAEDVCYHMLHFIYPHIVRQYRSDVYPFNCDFYDPNSNTYFEFNGSWTHCGHFFDKNCEEDLKRLEVMKSKNTLYYENAIQTWTVRDIKKRKTAEENNLNYVVFWNLKDVQKYVLLTAEKVNKNVITNIKP